MAIFESVIAILCLIPTVSSEGRFLANVECDINPAPPMILFCVLLIWLLIYLLCLLLDQSQKKMFVEREQPNTTVLKVGEEGPKTVVGQRDPLPENVNPGRRGEGSSSENNKGNSDYTDNYYLAPEVSYDPLKKTRLGEIFEGHLTFGLYLFRGDYPRILRIFTIITIWLFELLIIGVLFYSFEDTNDGDDNMDSNEIADNYKSDYFAYAVCALLICIPVAIYLIVILSNPGFHVFWFLSALFVGVAIIIGTIVGVVFLTYDICHEWGGYWAISYVICITMEIFLFETIYMFIRWKIVEYHRHK